MTTTAKFIRAVPITAELQEWEGPDGVRKWIAAYRAEVDGQVIIVSIGREAHGVVTPDEALRQAQPSIFGL